MADVGHAAQSYPGKLGVIEEGAYADMLLVDGNPLKNIELVGHLKRVSYSL